MFDHNTAGTDGGAIFCNSIYSYQGYCNLSFEGYSTTIFRNNIGGSQGAISLRSYIGKSSFDNFSTTTFSHNIAEWRGGAIYSSTPISFKANSTTKFNDNIASYTGGAVDCRIISFEDSSATVFSNNIAKNDGGAVDCYSISFEDSSATVFSNNIAKNDGGAIFSNSDVVFSDNCTVKFTDNNAMDGASVYSYSKVMALENSTILFNDHVIKWCNSTCIPYRERHSISWDAIIINSNGVVWCSNQKSLICSHIKCYCKSLEHLLDGLTNNAIVNITDNVKLTSIITLRNLENISIIGHNNITIICSGIDGGGLYLWFCNMIIVEGFTWIGCGTNNTNIHKPVMEFDYSSEITIQNCTFQYSIGQIILIYGILEDVNINHCNFMNNNHYRHHGACIDFSYGHSYIRNSTININNCNFRYNGDSESIVHFGDPSGYLVSFPSIYIYIYIFE